MKQIKLFVKVVIHLAETRSISRVSFKATMDVLINVKDDDANNGIKINESYTIVERNTNIMPI